MDIERKKKEKRIQLIGGLIGICVAVVSLFYFFHVEKTEAEKRMVEIVNYVKVQCSTYTHYNESSESKSLLRAIESARQMSTNINMETENGGQLNREDERIPRLGNLISLAHRELIFTFLGKGYVDGVAAHEESIVQYMKDYDTSFRILEEPLMVVGIGVAFAKEDDRGICEEMDRTLEEMRQDGTSLKIIGKYLDDPEKYLEVDDLGY